MKRTQKRILFGADYATLRNIKIIREDFCDRGLEPNLATLLRTVLAEAANMIVVRWQHDGAFERVERAMQFDARLMNGPLWECNEQDQ